MKKVIIIGLVAGLIGAGVWPGVGAHPGVVDERKAGMVRDITRVIEEVGIKVTPELSDLIEVIVDHLPLSLVFLVVFLLNIGWAILTWFIINAPIRLIKRLGV